MPDPFNYIINTPQPDFARDFTQGMAIGDIIRKREMDAQQMAAARAQQEAMQNDIESVYKNTSVQGILGLMVKYPQYSDKFKESLASMTEQEKENRIRQANDVFMPFMAGKRELGLENLKSQELAAVNRGDTKSAQSLGMMRKLVESADTGEIGDNMVKTAVGSWLAAAMGEKEFSKVYGTLLQEKRAEEKAPSELKKSEADAEKARAEANVAAKYLDQETAAKLKETGIRTQAILDDTELKRAKNRIDAMQAATARMAAGTQLEEHKLKLETAKREFGEKALARADEAASTFNTIDTLLATTQEALNMGNKKTLGIKLGTVATGPVAGRLPTLDSDVSNFRETLETARNQIFSIKAREMKGLLGQLTELEGSKLESGIRSLKGTQDWNRISDNLNEIQRLMRQARARAAKKFGVKEPEENIPPGAGAAERTVIGGY